MHSRAQTFWIRDYSVETELRSRRIEALVTIYTLKEDASQSTHPANRAFGTLEPAKHKHVRI
jgi:hypothetical protein